MGEAMNVDEIRAAADYQRFDLDARGALTSMNPRIAAKLEALQDLLPSFEGRNVLDLGCDMGAWSFMASSGGAAQVLGVDRNRNVRGVGEVDLCELNRRTAGRYEMHRNVRFRRMEMGVQWHDLGRFDLVLMMSVYHHVFQAAGGDHAAVWYWLARQMEPGGMLLWEGPTDCSDVVSAAHIDAAFKPQYNEDAILDAASEHFDLLAQAPALHEDTRTVFQFTLRKPQAVPSYGEVVSTSGGATRCFLHAGARRMLEIHEVLGFVPYPGSLNVQLDARFDFGRAYYRGSILDVADRRQGLDGEWVPRRCRFYPLSVDGQEAFAMRFEGEKYREDFLEVIASGRLRDRIGTDVQIERSEWP